ncbi:MAG: MarR family winged helix-turn-helix transcriptional regulator [Alphaproteobacteria bacterium]
MDSLDEFDGHPLLGDSVPYLAQRIGYLLDRAIQPHLAEHDLTLDMWRIIYILKIVGDHNLIELSRATGINSSTLSRMIGRMHQRGLISRERSATDNRTVIVRLLVGGTEIFDRILPFSKEMHALVVKDFDSGEIPVLKSFLRRLYGTLMTETDKQSS